NSTAMPQDEGNIAFQSSTTESQKQEGDQESYSARFDRIFGKKKGVRGGKYPSYVRLNGTSLNFDIERVSAKGREHFLKESSQAKIDLTGSPTNNRIFSRGHTIKGTLIILAESQNQQKEQKKSNRNRRMRVTLSGIEYAFANGYERINAIENYQKDVEIDRTESSTNKGRRIPFEFQIPEGVNQSYVGKFSEYFWGLEAKVDVALSSDINARTIREVL
ncbi:MAG: hypothetical protein M3247_07810, partial [Thermoproteota archaeon]|nr:hypothetical protein [Thermoproteota archaeon]